MRWTVGLLFVWGLLATGVYARDNLPPSWWLVPGTLSIGDAPHGTCNPVTYNRDIKRSFHGRWIGTLQRQTRTGGFAVFRIYVGEADYRSDTSLPDFIDLGWWFETDSCNWPPGTYRVLTQWTLHPGTDRQTAPLRVASLPFDITGE